MARTNTRRLVLLSLFMAFGTAGQTQHDPRTAHGTFTGEIKPVLYVSDVEKSAPFYRDALGFDFAGFANSKGEPYYAELLAAGVKFGLHEPTSDAQQGKVGQQRLYFRVKNLQAHCSRVVAWGADPGEIKETAWMDMFIVNDPDGNEIVFAATDPERHSSNPWRVEDAATTRGKTE